MHDDVTLSGLVRDELIMVLESIQREADLGCQAVQNAEPVYKQQIAVEALEYIEYLARRALSLLNHEEDNGED